MGALTGRLVAMSCPRLEALAEANDQLHWGTKIEEIEDAARLLRELNLNPTLADKLALKAAGIRIGCAAPADGFGVVIVMHGKARALEK